MCLCVVLSYLSTDSSFSTAVSRAGRTVALSTGSREARKHVLSAGRMKKLQQQYILHLPSSARLPFKHLNSQTNTVSCTRMTGRWGMHVHAHGSIHIHIHVHTHMHTHTYPTHHPHFSLPPPHTHHPHFSSPGSPWQ